MPEAVCTLFEKHYHHGVAGLINSLVKAGFAGTVYCGYRDVLPKWAAGGKACGENYTFKLNAQLDITFIHCNPAVHFTHYKPTFMRALLENSSYNISQLHYLDPDIVLNCSWETMRRWATGGIALCEDFNGHLPARHPLRMGWKLWVQEHPELSIKRELDRYYSGGYVAVPAEMVEFLKIWETIILSIGESSNDLKKLCLGKSEAPFYLSDQDGMNIALMCTSCAINGTGAESMGFIPHGRAPRLLFHAIGGPKPWQGGFLKKAMRGCAPTHAARYFLKNISGPIKSLPGWRRALLKLEFQLALHLARVIRPTEYSYRYP